MEEQLVKLIWTMQDEWKGLQETLTDAFTIARVGIPCQWFIATDLGSATGDLEITT